MRIYDILNAESCKKIFDEVQLFVERSLSAYNESIRTDGFYFVDKDIFDSVWGTVECSKTEMCVLDSPLLQRLRHIKQLGFANTVYCDAVSTRFSHTIGVLELAGRISKVVSSKLENNLQRNFPDYCDYDAEEIVRLAAIFHDTGHMFYSHVSEMYFAYDRSFPRYKEITKARAYFAKCSSSEISLHELLSVMIVNSEDVFNLFKIMAPHMKKSRINDDYKIRQFIEFISCLIIGRPTNKFILPFSMIINSALDANKFDYLMRDSQSTKVPIAVDIPRVIRKLDVVSTSQIERTEIWEDMSNATIPFKVMAISNSAKNAFFQLANARSNMYESVYYHHKILTAETMFRDVLRKVFSVKSAENISFTDILELTDDAFDSYWKCAIFSSSELEDLLKEDASSEIANKLVDISNSLNMIRYRQLYKRVAAFSVNLIIGESAPREDFLNHVIQDPFSKEFVFFNEQMTKEYGIVCKILGLTPCEKPEFTFIYSQYSSIPSAPVERGDGYCIWSEEYTKQDIIDAGKKSKQEQYFLVTNCSNRIPVYLALEKVLTQFGIVRLKEEASLCLKTSLQKLNQDRLRLLENNYYKDILYILSDDFLINKVYSLDLINKVEEKYRSFQGVNNCKITKESILLYLRQFLRYSIDYNDMVNLFGGILKILMCANYLDRETFVIETKKLLQKILSSPEYPKTNIIFLGGLFDSGNHWMYYFNDLDNKSEYSVSSNLKSVLDSSRPDELICFFDDGAYSGKQVVSIFQEFMGIPLEERTTNEHHVDELSDDQKKLLINRKIILGYLCFNSGSEEYIQSELRKIGLNNVTIMYNNDLSHKIFDDDTEILSQEQKDIVKKYLGETGRLVLESTKKISDTEYKDRWDEVRVNNSSLGYNNAQQATIFYSNIPTYTLTAFWANGQVLDKPWKGLFQRTNKD